MGRPHSPATIARRERIEKFLADAGHTQAVLIDDERGFSKPGFWAISSDDGITTVSYKIPQKDVGKNVGKTTKARERALQAYLATLNNAPRYRAVLHANGCSILGAHIEVVEV